MAFGGVGPPPPGDAPRASLVSQAAVLATVGIAFFGLVVATGEVASPVALWLGLAAGTAVATFTPASRLFRRVSAWVGGLVVFIVLLLATAFTGLIAMPAVAYFVLAATTFVIGLDLCWVSRLRVVLLLSGLLLVPVLWSHPGGSIVWVAVWFVSMLVTQWLLTADTDDALGRPEMPVPVRPGSTRRPLDLATVAGIALAGGLLLALVASVPNVGSFQPFGKWFPDLPFHPKFEPKFDPKFQPVDRLPVADFELDPRGNEVQYQIDQVGRRYVDGPDGRELAVVEKGGDDVILDVQGRVAATMVDAEASEMRVPSGPKMLTYLRDDDGWYLKAGETRFHVQGDDVATLVAPDGTSSEPADDDGTVYLSGEAFQPVRQAFGTIVSLPPSAVLRATTGTTSSIVRGQAETTFRDTYGTRRYQEDDGRLKVRVVEGYGPMAYTWAEDRQLVTVSGRSFSGNDITVAVAIDRTGNHFDVDYRDPPKPKKSSFWSGFKQAAIVILIGLVLLGVFLIVRKIRRNAEDETGPSSRVWAENELARLEELGLDHAVHRRDRDSVIRFTRNLATQVDEGQPRIADVGVVLDGALYDRRTISAAQRLEVSSIIDRVIEERPKATRADRRERAEADAATTR